MFFAVVFFPAFVLSPIEAKQVGSGSPPKTWPRGGPVPTKLGENRESIFKLQETYSGVLGRFGLHDRGRRAVHPDHADLAGLIVAGAALIVIGVSMRLGKKSIDDLLDSVPLQLQEQVRDAAVVRRQVLLEVTRADQRPGIIARTSRSIQLPSHSYGGRAVPTRTYKVA